MKILHMSDLHVNDENHEKLLVLFKSLSKLKDLNEYVVVVTGDLTDTSSEHDTRLALGLFGLIARAKDILFVAGNHDYLRIMGNGFTRCGECINRFNTVFGVGGYPIETVIDGYRFVGINTANARFFASGEIGLKQIIDLRGIVKKNKTFTDTIIYMHHHPFKHRHKWWKIWKWFSEKTMELEDSKMFMDTIKDTNVGLVLYGHKHMYLGKKIKNNITFVNGGSTSGKESRFGVALIEYINGEKKVTLRWEGWK